jgi:hypothetical protein
MKSKVRGFGGIIRGFCIGRSFNSIFSKAASNNLPVRDCPQKKED